MRKLSLWGKNNPLKARLIIIFSHIILFNLAWFTGNQLVSIGVDLPEYLKYLIVFVFLLAFITYPSSKNKSGYKIVSYYVRQKTCDFVFALSFFGLVVCLTVSDENISTFFPDISASTSPSVEKSKTKPKAAEILASLEHRDKSSLTRSEKRVLKKEFKKQIGIYVTAKITGEKEKSDQTLLIILAIIAALGLFLVVAALACTLGCNGSGTGAIAVAVLGTAAIVFGLIVLIRAIEQKGKKQPPKEKESMGT
ncbi:MAG TPA: hypothetical protein VK492_15775 [Chitinophagaceae bacterium]|nr:hypothetical protein [Chitinophagaceae bacterium]